MKLRPLGNRVLLIPEQAAEKTAGGIFLPDTAKEKPQKGSIVAVGAGSVKENGERTPMELKVGDNVLYGKYSGTEITYEGENYLIMQESDIMAIL
nr:MAG: co-chaperone GroES [Erwiniaceae bacterium 4572_131]